MKRRRRVRGSITITRRRATIASKVTATSRIPM
jgi:hypothetical protein